MITVIIEATNGPQNWGKFMVGKFDEQDFAHPSAVHVGFGHTSVLRARGHHAGEVLVLDLETGEGAIFRHGGLASADLNKHRIWVCPLFEPFLTWLYTQDVSDLTRLPTIIDLPAAPFDMHGYRREGPRLDAAEAILLVFGSMSSRELRALWSAHTTDRDAASNWEAINFSVGRIRLIEAVLQTRGETP